MKSYHRGTEETNQKDETTKSDSAVGHKTGRNKDLRKKSSFFWPRNFFFNRTKKKNIPR